MLPGRNTNFPLKKLAIPTLSLVAIAIVALVCWGMWRLYRLLRPMQIRYNEWFLGKLESHGHPVVLTFVAAVLLSSFVGLAITYLTPLHIFTRSRSHKYYWLKAITVFLLILELVFVLGFAISKHAQPEIVKQHPDYWGSMGQCITMVALLLVGISIFAVKQASKILYGCAESIASLVTSFLLLRNFDFSGFPMVHIYLQDAVLLAGATYALSKGMKDLLEGIQEKVDQADVSTFPPIVTEEA